ncbi:MAG: Tm-1-like ATP-binding domain-containing protein, partial [Rhizobiales bacterium]|nr:Tm-1-like ATP-binding domain-containing protein [Hyphomicrobiales bacterium]
MKKKIFVVGTCDTKQRELEFVRSLIIATGAQAMLVDVGTRGAGGNVDISAEEVANHHPGGRRAVLGLDDRGVAVTAMSEALIAFLRTRDDIGGMIGLGGSGNTALVTAGMRSLPVGLPKIMVSTIASGNVAPYVGPTDICMMYSITDIAGINKINAVVLGNAAHAIAGMVSRQPPECEGSKPQIGLTQFGVTTTCVDLVRARIDEGQDCMVFHATGIGGQSMEKLV